MKVCFFGTYDRTYSSNRLILQGLRENNVPVVEINAHTKVTLLDSASDMTWYHIIRRVFKKFKIFAETFKNIKGVRECDVIYVGYPGHADIFFAFVIAKLFGKKLVFNPLLTVYVGFTEERIVLGKRSLLGLAIKIGEGLAYKICDLIFADTPYQKVLLIKVFGLSESKIKVLPIGADNKGYEYSENKNKGNRVNVVYYGLYSPIHGVEHLISAAQILKDDKDVEFNLVGWGSEYQKNYDRAKELKLKNVIFHPDILEGQHLELLQKADIFIGFLQKHPSVDRIIPNKVYQGLALGRTVLTADAPVTRSVFENKKDMYFIEAANPRAIADAILDLKSNPRLRLEIAAQGYNRYVKEFSPKKVVAKMINYINEIL